MNTTIDLDNIKEMYLGFANALLPTNWPTDKGGTFMCFACKNNPNYMAIQVVFGNRFTDGNRIYYRTAWGSTFGYGNWKTIQPT